jgi:hypothetical protein
MTSMASAAVAAIISALSSGTPVATQIARVRLRPMAQAQSQAVVVRPLQSEVSEMALIPGQPVSWTTAISVECYARTSVATAPDVAVDSLVEAVYARLMADPTLGGVVLSLRPQSLHWDFDADGEQTTCATLEFHARHRSPGSTLS